MDELVESDNSEADDQDFLEDDDDDNEEEEVYAAKPSTSRSSGQTSSSFYSAAAKKASAASSSTYKSSTLSANATNKPTTIKLNLKGGKIIHYENVTIPMGDKSIIDKFLSWQVNPETDQEEILIKYKVKRVFISICNVHTFSHYLSSLSLHLLINFLEHELLSR